MTATPRRFSVTITDYKGADYRLRSQDYRHEVNDYRLGEREDNFVANCSLQIGSDASRSGNLN